MAGDMFIKIGDIVGEAQDAIHGGEIEVHFLQWGMSQNGTMHIARGGGGGKVSVQNLTFKKSCDRATPNLMAACSSGQTFPEAALSVRKSGGNPLEYLLVKMENVIVTDFTLVGLAEGEQLSESVTLNFARVCVDYQQQASDGSPKGGVICYAWDIAGNKAM